MASPEPNAAIFSLAMLGQIGTIVSCGLPICRVKNISEDISMDISCPVQPQDRQVSLVHVVICVITT